MSPDDRGWISLHRKLKEHWLWDKSRKFSEIEAWIDLLLHATHHSAKVRIGNAILTVNRGEQIRSLKTLAKEWNWSRSRVKRFLDLLQSDNMIVTKNETQTTRITICNYDSYQNRRNAYETQVKRKRNANETQVNTDNNENNANNVNNENKTSPEQNRNNTTSLDADEDEEEAAGCSVLGGDDFLCVEDLPVSDAAGIPDSVDEVLAYCRSYGIKPAIGKAFYAYFKKQRWKTKKGQAVTKWQAKFKGWLKFEKNEWRVGVEPEPPKKSGYDISKLDLNGTKMSVDEFLESLNTNGGGNA